MLDEASSSKVDLIGDRASTCLDSVDAAAEEGLVVCSLVAAVEPEVADVRSVEGKGSVLSLKLFLLSPVDGRLIEVMNHYKYIRGE